MVNTPASRKLVFIVQSKQLPWQNCYIICKTMCILLNICCSFHLNSMLDYTTLKVQTFMFVNTECIMCMYHGPVPHVHYTYLRHLLTGLCHKLFVVISTISCNLNSKHWERETNLAWCLGDLLFVFTMQDT